MVTISEALAIAVREHQAGRLEAAEQRYRQILQAEPRNPDATHLLGVLAYQAGKHPLAAELIAQAIALKGDEAHFHSNLGKVLQASGRNADAIECFRRAVELGPGVTAAQRDLGCAQMERGNFFEAAVSLRRAVELDPSSAETHNILGNALKVIGKVDEAVACYTRALQLKPDYAVAQNNLAAAWKAQGKLEEAIRCVARALEMRPDYAVGHNNLGLLLKDQGRSDDAIASFRRAVELEPDFFECLNNLGSAFFGQARFEEAANCFRRAVEINPSFAEAHNNLGLALHEQGKTQEAVGCCRRALELNRDFADAHKNVRLLLLTLGRYEEGWREEARGSEFSAGSGQFLGPAWAGEEGEGKTMLVHWEEGFGDTIFFVRYAFLLAKRARASRVILECQPELARLLSQNVGGRMEITPRGARDDSARPHFDFHLPFLSLPWALRSFEPEPVSGAYLRAEAEERARWRERLGSAAELRVGVAWKGRPTHVRDQFRSIPCASLLALVKTAGVRFYSLQIDATASESAALARAGVVDLTAEIRDFADTAALASELDLIISVDTALVHLAGALGLPVWTMIPFVPDWRWGLESDSTAWYPTMRLFRQPVRGDWDSVLRRVGKELALLVGSFHRSGGLERQADLSSAYESFGNAYMKERRLEEAAGCFHAALGLTSDKVSAHINLGVALEALGKREEAIACYRRALRLDPESAEAKNNLGKALRDQGEMEEAAACLRSALDLRPDFAEAHYNLGNVLVEQRKLDEAVSCFRRALEINPDWAEGHHNLGVAFVEQGKLAEATAAYGRALELKPDYFSAHHNLAKAYREHGKLEEAIASLRRAVEISPECSEARLNLAHNLLQVGCFQEGWAEYEARLAVEARRGFSAPRWDLGTGGQHGGAATKPFCANQRLGEKRRGAEAQRSQRMQMMQRERPAQSDPCEDLGAFRLARQRKEEGGNDETTRGRTILLHCEQGLGDMIQFFRYAESALERMGAGRIILECQPELVRLLEQNANGEIQIVERRGRDGEGLPPFDWHLPLMSLPLTLGAFEPLSIAGPYLRADSEGRAIWRNRLGDGTEIRVGLVWKGTPGQMRDQFRSIPCERFLPLLKTAGVRFYSLQIGATESERAAVAREGAVDFTGEIREE